MLLKYTRPSVENELKKSTTRAISITFFLFAKGIILLYYAQCVTTLVLLLHRDEFMGGNDTGFLALLFWVLVFN